MWGVWVIGQHLSPLVKKGNPSPLRLAKFETDLLSWITILDAYKDGGILKRVVKKGDETGQPCDLDEVIVKYVVKLPDGVIIYESPKEGVEFYLKDGVTITSLPNGFSPIPPNSMLHVELELVSFKSVVHMTNDSKMIKKILKEDEVRYTGMLEDGTVFEKKSFDADEEQVICGLDRGVARMRKREKAILTINHEYGYESQEINCDLAEIPPFSNLIYEVEMIQF
ncbi:unnamed protein product [Lactuca saligna]|uniref:peptidylprolyl isomerase n=1 Tax=Lactuca saligna TaxID=75948 RepID=A0AA36E664_LACSI|nr:unnamed protein product [Lactuca saligna]